MFHHSWEIPMTQNISYPYTCVGKSLNKSLRAKGAYGISHHSFCVPAYLVWGCVTKTPVCHLGSPVSGPKSWTQRTNGSLKVITLHVPFSPGWVVITVHTNSQNQKTLDLGYTNHCSDKRLLMFLWKKFHVLDRSTNKMRWAFRVCVCVLTLIRHT